MLIDQSGTFDPDLNFWPTFRRDPWNRGTYAPAVSYPDVTVNLTPYGVPILIPPGGGSFDYNVAIANNETGPQAFDGWIMVTLPNGSQYGPVLGPINLTLSGGSSVNRDRTQFVPANAPAGDYTYDAYVGVYPTTIWSSDSFPFTKSAAGDGSAWIDEWLNTGEPFESDSEIPIPADFSLGQNYPNPFNAQTVIPIALPQRSQITVTLYNLMGQRVATVYQGVQNAGQGRLRFDASLLPSGVYFYRVEASGLERGGKFKDVGKMLLLK